MASVTAPGLSYEDWFAQLSPEAKEEAVAAGANSPNSPMWADYVAKSQAGTPWRESTAPTSASPPPPQGELDKLLDPFQSALPGQQAVLEQARKDVGGVATSVGGVAEALGGVVDPVTGLRTGGVAGDLGTTASDIGKTADKFDPLASNVQSLAGGVDPLTGEFGVTKGLGLSGATLKGIAGKFGQFAEGEDPVLAAQRERALETQRAGLARQGVTGTVAENEAANTRTRFDEMILAQRNQNLLNQANVTGQQTGVIGQQLGAQGLAGSLLGQQGQVQGQQANILGQQVAAYDAQGNLINQQADLGQTALQNLLADPTLRVSAQAAKFPNTPVLSDEEKRRIAEEEERKKAAPPPEVHLP